MTRVFTGTSERLERLRNQALRLSAESEPQTADVLQIYPHLREFEVVSALAGHYPDRDRLAELAAVSGCTPERIAAAMHNVIRLDFGSYDQSYGSAWEAYRRAGLPDREVRSFFSQVVPGAVCFVLHGVLSVWDGHRRQLDDLHIEHRDFDESDDFPDLVEGYLVSRGLDFETSVDILEASFCRQWPDWQSLWTWF